MVLHCSSWFYFVQLNVYYWVYRFLLSRGIRFESSFIDFWDWLKSWFCGPNLRINLQISSAHTTPICTRILFIFFSKFLFRLRFSNFVKKFLKKFVRPFYGLPRFIQLILQWNFFLHRNFIFSKWRIFIRFWLLMR